MSGVASTKPAPSLEGLSELARLSLDGSSEASRSLAQHSTWTWLSSVRSTVTSS
jgi:hypothetical protein